MADAFAVTEGLKEIHLEHTKSIPIDTDTVLKSLESDRGQGFSGKPITSAPFYFEASISRPGFLDKVDTVTGKRQTGRFQHGKFEVVS